MSRGGGGTEKRQLPIMITGQIQETSNLSGIVDA